MCIKKGHYRREDAVPGGHYETLLNKPELCAWNQGWAIWLNRGVKVINWASILLN